MHGHGRTEGIGRRQLGHALLVLLESSGSGLCSNQVLLTRQDTGIIDMQTAMLHQIKTTEIQGELVSH